MTVSVKWSQFNRKWEVRRGGYEYLGCVFRWNGAWWADEVGAAEYPTKADAVAAVLKAADA